MNPGRRVIDYFTLLLNFTFAMCLIPFHSPSGPSDWLLVMLWKRPTKLLERPPSLWCPARLPCQSAILFPDSTVISQPSGAALSDLCLDLRLNSPSFSTSSSPGSSLGPPLLIYEPFHTVLLPLETKPWPTLHGILTKVHQQGQRDMGGGGLVWETIRSIRYIDWVFFQLNSRLYQTIRRQIYQSMSWFANITFRWMLEDHSLHYLLLYYPEICDE